ncbi:proton-coupled folate transporter-like isoform X2 [Dysidea avara]|uniref:proton-coupled folate transporter-like isoform X2 n=1 Tax=Dysidea avara TaxID=196820 RepID=UPI003316D383
MASGCKRYIIRPTVEPVLLMFMLGGFLSYPVLQQLIYAMICEDTKGCENGQNETNSQCGKPSDVEQHVQTATSHWLLYINIANGIPSILSALVAGGASDHIGRKILIIIASAGGTINMIVILMTYYAALPKYVFLFGASISGCMGGFTVVNLAVYSYMADISSIQDRTCRFGILESMTYIGGSLGGLIGGLWLKGGNYVQPFYAVAALHIAVFIACIIPCLIPESVKAKKGATFNLITVLQQNMKSFVEVFIHGEHFNILLPLLLIFLFVEINFLGLSDVVVLFSLGKPLCWSPENIGYFLSLKVAFNGFASLFLLPLLSKKLKDTIIIIIGLLSGAVALVALGLSYYSWIVLTVPILGAFRGCVVPVLRAMMSKYCPRDKEASVLYNAVYPLTRKLYPGLCFHVMAVLLSVPFLLTLYLHVTTKQVAMTEYNEILEEVGEDHHNPDNF